MSNNVVQAISTLMISSAVGVVMVVADEHESSTNKPKRLLVPNLSKAESYPGNMYHRARITNVMAIQESLTVITVRGGHPNSTQGTSGHEGVSWSIVGNLLPPKPGS